MARGAHRERRSGARARGNQRRREIERRREEEPERRSGQPVSWWRRLWSWLVPRRRESEQQQRARRLGELIDYRFRDAELLDQALRHRSYLMGTRQSRLISNERLELLGDAVLGLAVTEFLFHRFPRKPEGELTNIKSLVVSRKVLSRVARRIRLGEFILMSHAEERSGGRERPSILSDSLEALIGAIYLDGGFQEAMRFVRRYVLSGMNEFLQEELFHNYKSELLEYAQARNWGNPVYRVIKEEGPDHDKTFTVEVEVAGQTLGTGKGHTKKRAEQLAAREALKQLRNQQGERGRRWTTS